MFRTRLRDALLLLNVTDHAGNNMSLFARLFCLLSSSFAVVAPRAPLLRWKDVNTLYICSHFFDTDADNDLARFLLLERINMEVVLHQHQYEKTARKVGRT